MKFFVGYVVTGDLGEKIDLLRREIASRFDVHDALLLPPHVTLVRPFEHLDGESVVDAVRNAIAQTVPFTIRTEGFAAFQKDVWFIELEQAKALFDAKYALEAELGPRVGWKPDRYDQQPHFHLTLAYRDLTPEKHEAIGEFLKTRTCPIDALTVDSVTLLLHGGERWTPYRTLQFER